MPVKVSLLIKVNIFRLKNFESNISSKYTKYQSQRMLVELMCFKKLLFHSSDLNHEWNIFKC